MKYMNNHYGVSRIFCAPSATDGQSGGADDEAGDDQNGEDGPDEDGGDDEPEEKKYTEKDMEDAVKRRLTRERRKWQRQQKPEDKSNSGEEAGKTGVGNEEAETDRKTREAEEKASALELKWTCLEHDVNKSCVDDVLALARVHVSKDSSLDIEDAIDKVLEKYPQFKDGYSDTDEGSGPGEKKKGWGQRQGKPPKKSETVDDEIRKQLFGE